MLATRRKRYQDTPQSWDLWPHVSAVTMKKIRQRTTATAEPNMRRASALLPSNNANQALAVLR